MSSRRQEDLSQNRFLQVLRASFEGIYRQAAQRGDRTVILVPCAECLEAEHFGQSFVETHLLQASPMPGCFMNHLGQGVEIKENSVATQLGFQEHRLCEVLQKDSMYDLSNTFKVLVIDKPLIGRFKPLSAAVPEPGSAGNLDDLLLHSPSIQGEFFDEVDRFRKTFVQVPGCENRTAERIREIVTEAVDKLSRQHKVTSASQVAQLEFKVSRQAYTALYSFIFPHLQSLLTEKEDQLQRSVRSYGSLDDLLKAVPGGERLCFVDVTESAAELELLEGKIAPHEKIECVDKAHALLQKSIASLAPERSSTPMEITGDDVLSLFILVVYRSQVKNFLAHVCHMEMYLQGPSRSGGGARFEEAGYAVSALQAGLQFFMEEERPVAPTGPSVFSCLGSQGPEEASHLQGLVRSARAQGQQGPQNQWSHWKLRWLPMMQVRAERAERQRLKDPVEWGRRRQQSIKEAEVLRAEGRFGHLTTEHTFRPAVPRGNRGNRGHRGNGCDRSPGGLSPRPNVSCSIVRGLPEVSEPLVWRQLPSESLAAKAMSLLEVPPQPESLQSLEVGPMQWHPEHVPELEPMEVAVAQDHPKHIEEQEDQMTSGADAPSPRLPARFSWNEWAPEAEDLFSPVESCSDESDAG